MPRGQFSLLCLTWSYSSLHVPKIYSHGFAFLWSTYIIYFIFESYHFLLNNPIFLSEQFQEMNTQLRLASSLSCTWQPIWISLTCIVQNIDMELELFKFWSSRFGQGILNNHLSDALRMVPDPTLRTAFMVQTSLVISLYIFLLYDLPYDTAIWPKKNECAYPQKPRYENIYCSFMCNSPELKKKMQVPSTGE